MPIIKSPLLLENFTDNNSNFDIESVLDDMSMFKISNSITVHSKLERTFTHYVSKSLLLKVDADIVVAVELCLLMSSLITQYGEYELCDYETGEIYNDSKYTYIASQRLKLLFGEKRYKKILNVLMSETKKREAFIECDNECLFGNDIKENNKVYGYRFTKTYRDKGLKIYHLKTAEGVMVYHKILRPKLQEVANDVIASKMFTSYASIELPTIDEIEMVGATLLNTRLKSGKVLKRLGNNDRKVYVGNYSFLEDHIKQFKLLTDGGLLVPIISKRSTGGGRVVDSFTLMPSWIRGLCKIDGIYLSEIEADYTALHPNLALKLYGSKEEYDILGGDTHTIVAEGMNIDRNVVKTSHLSFFNKTIGGMYADKDMMNFYQNEASIMVKNIISKKSKSKNHKIVSSELFCFEVDIMREVIKRLKHDDVIVYIYDAICMKDVDRLKDIMNEVAEEFGLYKLNAK